MRRFAVDRGLLIQELSEVFALAACEGWADADARNTLHLIERRQRNRAAIARSAHESLEAAISIAEFGLDRPLVGEMAQLSGLKPSTLVQIFADVGGEPSAVFAKAVGLKRPYLITLLRALKLPFGDPDSTDNPLGRVLYVFDTLATAKAQTVLRYWNWKTPTEALGLEDEAFIDETDLGARRTAAMRLFRVD